MQGKTIIIGISGPTASGKSLLANTIVKELGSDQVTIISEDSYYKDRPNLSHDERCKINYDHPDAFDHDLLCQHIKQLQDGETVQIPTYDFGQHLRSDKTCQVGQHQLIVIEGILLFADPKLREMLDIRIYMDAPLDICLIRRLERDINERARSLESVLDQYQQTVRPMYLQFIEPSKKFADIIVPRGGANRIAIEVIQAKMRELLGYNHGQMSAVDAA
jgi:uridine kinase